MTLQIMPDLELLRRGWRCRQVERGWEPIFLYHRPGESSEYVRGEAWRNTGPVVEKASSKEDIEPNAHDLLRVAETALASAAEALEDHGDRYLAQNTWSVYERMRRFRRQGC